jgi:hypothetical protein
MRVHTGERRCIIRSRTPQTLFVREGEGVKLVPKGDLNEIEIIVVRRRSFLSRFLTGMIQITAFIATALLTGLADAFSKLFLN